MREITFRDISTLPRPATGLPTDYIFECQDDGRSEDDRIVAIMIALMWCYEQFGDGTDLALCPSHKEERLEPDHAWGHWPGGMIFIREATSATWFKIRWC